MLLAGGMQQGAHQEADKAKVGVLGAKAAEIEDAKDGLALVIQLADGAFQQVSAQALAVVQRPLACTGSKANYEAQAC